MSRFITHGTTTGYSYGCRCAKCKRANTEAHRKYMQVNPGLNADLLEEKRSRKRAKGECLDCPSNALAGYKLCKACLWKSRNEIARRQGRREISFAKYAPGPPRKR